FMNDGKHPWSKGRYWHEKEAIKMGVDFERLFLPQWIQKIARIDLLRTFTQSLFERKVYNNPSADFDQIYAEVINRCYLEANQQENPFYVLDNYLVGRPCNTVMFSVARTLVDLGLRSK
ncbi:MAG: hypothetical protein U9M98_00945, partial [Patescibacteria group bacterium]|nr:hypothetical protein [Patescibacteria group bacterium]